MSKVEYNYNIMGNAENQAEAVKDIPTLVLINEIKRRVEESPMNNPLKCEADETGRLTKKQQRVVIILSQLITWDYVGGDAFGLANSIEESRKNEAWAYITHWLPPRYTYEGGEFPPKPEDFEFVLKEAQYDSEYLWGHGIDYECDDSIMQHGHSDSNRD